MLKTFLYYLAICIDLNFNYILHLILLFIEGKYSLKKKVTDFLYYIKLVILNFSEELNTSKKIFVIISKITFSLRS